MSRNRGMGLVSAIFLILVVTILVVAISRMVRTSSEAFAQEVLSHKAFLAAESGAQPCPLLLSRQAAAQRSHGDRLIWRGFGLMNFEYKIQN